VCAVAGLAVSASAWQDAKESQDTPPPPIKVPTSKPKPAPTPVPVPVSGRDASNPPVTGISPQDQSKLDAYDAIQKQEAATHGAIGPRAPVNPKAKLDITFGEEKHDFGTMRQGESAQHTFTMRSAGEEALVITAAAPTCGCLVGDVKVKAPGADAAVPYQFGTPIEPGAEVTIDANIDTASKSNQTSVRLNVQTNDIVGAYSLVLNANIVPFLRVMPPFLQLGDIPQGQERTGVMEIRTSGGEAVLLTEDSSRQVPVPEGFSYELSPMNPDETGRAAVWKVNVKVAETAPEGPRGYAMTLLTDVPLPASTSHAKTIAPSVATNKQLPTVYNVAANLNYKVLGAVSLNPLYLSMGLVRPGQPVVRNVKLTAHDPSVDLSAVTVEIGGENGEALPWAEYFAASISPTPGMNAVDITLTLNGLPEGADGSFRGVITVRTGIPAKPEELVRFSGVCRKLAGVPGGGD